MYKLTELASNYIQSGKIFLCSIQEKILPLCMYSLVFFSFLFFSFLFFFFFSFFCYSNRRQPDPMKRKSKIGCIGQESNPDPFFLCVLCCVGICILRYAFSNMCPCCPYIFSVCVMLCWDLHHLNNETRKEKDRLQTKRDLFL